MFFAWNWKISCRTIFTKNTQQHNNKIILKRIVNKKWKFVSILCNCDPNVGREQLLCVDVVFLIQNCCHEFLIEFPVFCLFVLTVMKSGWGCMIDWLFWIDVCLFRCSLLFCRCVTVLRVFMVWRIVLNFEIDEYCEFIDESWSLVEKRHEVMRGFARVVSGICANAVW